MAAGQEKIIPLRVPPKCEATCFVHLNGVSIASALVIIHAMINFINSIKASLRGGGARFVPATAAWRTPRRGERWSQAGICATKRRTHRPARLVFVTVHEDADFARDRKG